MRHKPRLTYVDASISPIVPFMVPAGFRGTHPKICECANCLKKKIKLFKERIKLMNHPAFPPSADATVPVRAHWRRQPNHLRKQPMLRNWVLKEVNSLRRNAGEE